MCNTSLKLAEKYVKFIYEYPPGYITFTRPPLETKKLSFPRFYFEINCVFFISAIFSLKYAKNHRFCTLFIGNSISSRVKFVTSVKFLQTLAKNKSKLLRVVFVKFWPKTLNMNFQGRVKKFPKKSLYTQKKAKETQNRKLTYVDPIFWTFNSQIIFKLNFENKYLKKRKNFEFFSFLIWVVLLYKNVNHWFAFLWHNLKVTFVTQFQLIWQCCGFMYFTGD
jgi:hypothetical protein